MQHICILLFQIDISKHLLFQKLWVTSYNLATWIGYDKCKNREHFKQTLKSWNKKVSDKIFFQNHVIQIHMGCQQE